MLEDVRGSSPVPRNTNKLIARVTNVPNVMWYVVFTCVLECHVETGHVEGG